MTPEQAQWFAQTFDHLVTNVEQVVIGRTRIVRLAVACLLSRGHLLLDDVPGTGKTSLARALAQSVQTTHTRIQFTPDLLPSDVTGVTIFDQSTSRFVFHEGPVFASIVLADEINRASPKTQAALLEVMEEGRVTVDGTSHEVGDPFMVVATQNPVEQAGTYRLPEAQLDRFLLRTSLGYPDHSSTVAILAASAGRGNRPVAVEPVVTPDVVIGMADLAAAVTVDAALLDYVSRLVEATRSAPEVKLGVSVRGALALVRVSRTWAAASGRSYVLPDDVKALVPAVLAHRLVLDPDAEFAGAKADDVLTRILAAEAPPVQRVDSALAR